jgi:RNA polymerase sigma-70 factor (ECF subfamily)
MRLHKIIDVQCNYILSLTCWCYGNAAMMMFIIFSEEDLGLIRERNPVIFEKIFREYHIKIFNFLIIKTRGNTHAAEDLLSETFSAALVYAPKLAGVKNIQGWLIRIANNKFIDYYRKQKIRRKYISPQQDDQHNARLTAEETADPVLEREKHLMLELALKNIHPDYARLIELKHLQGKTNDELAQITGRTLSSVTSSLFRARKQLKKELVKLIKDYV